VYDIWEFSKRKQIVAFGCEYGQMNMIGMKTSYQVPHPLTCRVRVRYLVLPPCGCCRRCRMVRALFTSDETPFPPRGCGPSPRAAYRIANGMPLIARLAVCCATAKLIGCPLCRGFHSVSKPQLVESIISDVSALAASQASFHCHSTLAPPEIFALVSFVTGSHCSLSLSLSSF
jgi:hypothetical protein